MARSRWIVGVLISSMVGGVAVGQIAPPPPAEGEPLPKLEAPPPRPKPPPRPAAPPPVQRRRPQAPPQIQVPDIPHVPLVQRDAEGRLIRIEGNLDYAALKHNPTVGPETVDRLRPHAAEWHRQMEELVVDNLDLIQEIDGGLFLTLDFDAPNAMTFASDVLKTMIAVGNLGNYLGERSVLTKTQRDFHNRLKSDYFQAASRELGDATAAKFPDDQQQQMIEVGRHTFHDLTRDAIAAYHEILGVAAANLDEALARAELEPEDREAIAEHRDAVAAARTDAERVEAMKALLEPLPIDAQQEILRAALEIRGDRPLRELEEAAVKPDGREPVEDIDNPASGG